MAGRLPRGIGGGEVGRCFTAKVPIEASSVNQVGRQSKQLVITEITTKIRIIFGVNGVRGTEEQLASIIILARDNTGEHFSSSEIARGTADHPATRRTDPI